MRGIAASSTVFATTISTYVAISMAVPAAAHASTQWLQDNTLPGYSGGPGCATYIAVGPNNQPTIAGCSNSVANQVAYYLNYTSCGKNCFGGTYQWQEMFNSTAGALLPDVVRVEVDQWNTVYAIRGDGHVWGQPVDPGANVYLTDLTDWYVGKQLVDIAVDWTGGYWGLGYPGSGNAAPVYNSPETGPFSPNGPWSQVDAQDNFVGQKIVMWQTNTYSVPVVFDNFQIAYYDPNSGRFLPMPTAQLLDVTDHFVVALGNGFTEIFQYSDSAGTWVDFGSGLTSNGTWIVRIAASNAGPSQLWGFDTSGSIFYNSTAVVPK
jgi:hypothetical protein